MATAIAGPAIAEASEPTVYEFPAMVKYAFVSSPMLNWLPSVLSMVPTSRVQNSPWAIADIASMP